MAVIKSQGLQLAIGSTLGTQFTVSALSNANPGVATLSASHGVAVNDIQLWEFDEPRDYDAQIASANYETTSVYGFGHPMYYDNVIEVLRGEAEAETDGREGLKSLEVLIATYLSARDGRRVPLPLDY